MKRVVPEVGQESVWEYPRPPRLEDCSDHIKVVFGGVTIAKSQACKRVLETSHPPAYYIPLDDILKGSLVPTGKQSICEWKGVARYYHVIAGEFSTDNAAWSYLMPTTAFEPIRDYVAFYAHLMDACYVNEERVQSQQGGFYGGWITNKIVGPFKGPPGTLGW